MIEKHIVLEDVDPVILYGVNNTNIHMIKALYPKLRIVARGNVIHVIGDEQELSAFEENIDKLQQPDGRRHPADPARGKDEEGWRGRSHRV